SWLSALEVLPFVNCSLPLANSSAFLTQGLCRLTAFGRFLLAELRACRPVDHPVVLFVTGELVDRWIDPREEAVDRPRPGPRRGIADRELVSECFRTGERVALDEMHAISRSAPVSIRTETGGLDDERIALPVSARISQPLADSLRKVRASIQRNDANVVCRLRDHHDISRRLQDLRLGGQTARDSRRSPIPGDASCIRARRRHVRAARSETSRLPRQRFFR